MKESGEQGQGPKFRIESLYTSEGTVSFSPNRGGIITSLQLRAPGSQAKLREILYMEQSSFLDANKNVRGGIPILFPQAGPVKVEGHSSGYGDYGALPQHGLARKSEAWMSNISPRNREFTERVQIGPEHAYPHVAQLSMIGRIERNGTFYLKQSATNLSQSKDMPIAMGLHPYFHVPEGRKQEIVFAGMPTVESAKDAEAREIRDIAGKTIEECSVIWMNGGTVSLKNTVQPVTITIPGKAVLTLEATKEYKRFWIWSLPDKDFVCIEPVMRDENGLITDPHILRPGKSLTATFSIKLEKTP